MTIKPFKVIVWILYPLVRQGNRQTLLGDLEEEFRFVYLEEGRLRANLWYIGQIVKPFIFFIRSQIFWSIFMFINYIKISIRNIQRHKAYSLINISGLAVGMACFILIMLYVKYELSFDSFHKNKDNVYRVAARLPGEEFGMSNDILAVTPAPLSAALMQNFPEVEFSTKFNRLNRVLFSKGETSFYEAGIFADEHFFDVFSFDLISGDKDAALNSPGNIIISQRTAEKFFGSMDPIGKTLTCYRGDFIIAGVLRDIPENSHIQFDWILPFASQFREEEKAARLSRWNWDSFYTFVSMKPGFDTESFEKKLNEFTAEANAAWEARTNFRNFLQPLTDVHTTAGFRYELGVPADISLIRLFTAVAVFILLIACINTINLSTANAAKRAKEIGVRKVIGSKQRQLFWQFTGEAFFTCFISLLISIGLIMMILPFFNQFAERTIHLMPFLNDAGIVSLAAVVIVTGLVSGIYPAVYLSSLKPISVLNKRNGSKQKGGGLRNILILFQFSIAIVLMTASLVIYRQMDFIRNKNLGFNREQVLVLGQNDPGIRKNFDSFKTELQRKSAVLAAATSSQLPININSATGIKFTEDDGGEKLLHYQFIAVDYNFIDMFGMEIVKGRGFSKLHGSDAGEALIVNEIFAERIGWKDPIGKKVPQVWRGPNDKEYTVVGVVKDFHARPLHLEIKPVIMRCQPNSYWLHIRLKTQDLERTIADIEQLYNQFKTRYPFEYFFLDDEFNEMYKSEQKLGSMMLYANALAVFIACLGIFGLAAYTIERLTKEIGIRKVLGASIAAIVFRLSKNFTRWVLLANLIAWPAAYIALNSWLQGFAYRTELTIWPFLTAGALVLMIALLTISRQTIKAAAANPVDTLKYE